MPSGVGIGSAAAVPVYAIAPRIGAMTHRMRRFGRLVVALLRPFSTC